MWVENLLAGHTSAASSVSQATQQMQQDWYQSQGVQPIPTTDVQVVGDVLVVSGAAELGLHLPYPTSHDTGI